MDRLLRRPEVEAQVGLSRSTIYRLMDADAFPKPLKVSTKAVRWRQSDLDAWRESKGS